MTVKNVYACVQGTPGLLDCARYMNQKQYYTLQDILVVQYILNGGILMRQMHDTQDEYHVDLGSNTADGQDLQDEIH